jgi:protocatechuate 3,4-dioxygenase beta subunit
MEVARILSRVIRLLACVAAAVGLVLGLGATEPAAQNPCRPTPNDGAGPFSGTGINTPLRAKIGTGHVLRGRVLRAGDCRPVSRALVVLWQAGPNGYRSRGRGSVRSDRQGRFRFEGPVPTNYGRGSHIHMAVIHPAYEELTTRHDVPRGARSGRITIVLTPLL